MIAVTGKKEVVHSQGENESLNIGEGQVKLIHFFLTFRVTEQNSQVIEIVVTFAKGY